MAPAAEPSQPGPRGLRRVARARAPRVQLPARRHRRRNRAGQLEKLDEILELRAAVAARYRALLDGVDGVELPCDDDGEHERSWFVFVVALAAGVDREAVIESLADRGVQTARYLPCIHLQPYMRERYGFRPGMCPVAEDVAARTLALPFHAQLAEDDQAYVVEALQDALRQG